MRRADLLPVADLDALTDVTPASGSLPRNRNVQWLRAAAALMVLLYHASHYLAAERGDPRMAAVFGGEFGLVGVAVFFAISGALMAEILPRTAPPLFLLHRVARLYPAFLVASLVLSPLVAGRLSVDLRALSLVPIGDNGSYRLRVEWTLIFELFYYMVLTGLAALGGARVLRLFALAWLALTLAAAAVLPELRQATLVPTVVDLPFLAVNAAFAGGLLVPDLARRGVFQPAVAAIAITASMVLLQFGFTAGRLLASVVGIVLVGLALSASPRPGPERLAARALTRLGDWSYALYLCHVPVILVVMRHVDAAPLAQWTAAVVLSVLVAIPLGMLDLAIYRRLRRRLDAARPQALARGAGIYAIVYVVVGVVFLVKG